MADVRLTPAQKTLLAELRETGGLYITRYKRYHRTIQVLERRGLARMTWADHSRMAQDRWEATSDG